MVRSIEIPEPQIDAVADKMAHLAFQYIIGSYLDLQPDAFLEPLTSEMKRRSSEIFNEARAKFDELCGC